MTRDGLVEKNLATGEETRVTQRGQDFNLKHGAPNRSPDARESPQSRGRQATPANGAEPYGGYPGSVAETYSQEAGDFPAADTIRREIPAGGRRFDSPSTEPESRRGQHGAIHRRFDESNSDPEITNPDRPMEAARPVERDIGARSHEVPAGGSSPPQAQIPPPARASPSAQAPETGQHERLRFTEGAEDSAPSGYSRQRFHAQPVSGAASRNTNAGASEASKAKAPAASNRPSRLQFAGDERPPGSEPAPPANRKLEAARRQSERADNKLAQARDAIPTKKKLARARTYDEHTNKTKQRLQFEKTPLAPGEKRFKPPAAAAAPLNAAKGVTKMAGRGLNSQFHRKLYEAEHENVGVQAAHRAEIAGEGALRFGARSVRSAYRFHRNAPYRAVEKLERQAVKANAKLSYRKALAENPQLKSNVLSRLIQKRKIKRAYAKTARNAKRAGRAAKKTGSVVGTAAKATARFARRHPIIAGILALILLLLFCITSLFSSCSNIAEGTLSSALGAAYTAKDRDIDDAELNYTDWETGLQERINNAERDYPNFNEYRYEVDDIGHDPFELMAYLTARYQDFQYSEIEAELRAIFEEQYTLTFTPEVEIRYNDPGDANEDGDLEPYEWRILNVTLTARSFSDIIAPRMDAQQRERFDVYMQTKGSRQYLINPADTNWLPLVTDYYGWRIHPETGQRDFHTGIDIALPAGTEIIAGHDGIVAQTGDAGELGLTVVLEGKHGLVSKYAHCSEILVSAGQEVKKGGVIARSGAHLHLEILKDSQTLNPLFFSETGDDGSGKLPPGSPGGVEFPDYPGAPMDDARFAAMMEEAQKHIGKSYVFGASGPDKFDCSGFVCYVLNHSGVANVGRTNAQGLYNRCTPVSPEDAQPGDLIFFSGTYSTPNNCTHVGIVRPDRAKLEAE